MAGRGLANAMVCLDRVADGSRDADRCTNADVTGHFVLSAGSEHAEAVIASAPGYLSQLRQLSRTPQPGDIVIELAPGGARVTGDVVDATGGPVPGARVTLRASSGDVTAVTSSDEGGGFAIDERPGVSELCAQAEGYSRACRDVLVPSEAHVLVIAPESVIVGHVERRATGEPIAGASVTATNFNGLQAPARTALSRPDGSFVIGALPPGGYELVATSAVARSTVQRVILALGDTSAPITLQTEPAVRVSGLVIMSGEPCSRGDIELAGPAWLRAKLSDGGAVQVDGVPPGRYDATVSCDGAPSQTETLLVEDEPIERTWTLERLPGSRAPGEDLPQSGQAGSIRALVEVEGSAPVAVFAESEDGVPRRGQRRDGAYVFDGLGVGEYRVYVDDDYDSARSARIARDGERVEVALKAAPRVSIWGRVVAEDGASVADAWLSVYRSDSPTAATMAPPPTLADGDGEFELPAAAGVPYTLTVSSPLGDARMEGVTAGREVLVQVAAPASLSGRVLTESGELVPEFTLTYRDTRGPNARAQRGVQSTFHVPTLQPGPYLIEVSSALGVASSEVLLAPREEAMVTLTLNPTEPAGPE